MRVAHVSPVPFGPGGMFGGGERFPLELARAMAALTPTTYVSFGEQAARTSEDGLDTRILKTRQRLDGHPLNPVSEQLVPVLARADVVHFHQWETRSTNVGVVLARALGTKVFVTDHGGWSRNHARKLRLHRLVAARLDVSAFAGTFYPQFRSSSTIWGGVDTERYSPDPTVQRGRHATYVGRLIPSKGIDRLIEALDDDLELRVVGRPYDPAFFDRLQQLAEGKRVSFVLEADDADVIREYRQARVVVLPSLHEPLGAPLAPRAELLGLTLVEAMACGTPVICTRTGGMPEVVDDEVTGHVVEAHDVEQLRSALTRLTAPGPEWERFSLEARSRVLHEFTWTRVAERCLDAYTAAGAS